MKKLFIITLTLTVMSLTYADLVLEGVTLTDSEAKTLYNSVTTHAKKERREATNVDNIINWLEESKALANPAKPGELTAINNAINVVQVIGKRGAAQRWLNKPTARVIKQNSLDLTTLLAQEDVDQKTAFRDSLIADQANQSEIDTANTELTTAETALADAQALTINDFIVTP